MKLAFDVGSMGGLQMRFDFRASRLETLEQPVQQGHNGPLQCVEGLTLDLLTISRGAGANAQFDLLKPATKIHQQILHVCDNNFKIR